MLLDTPYIECLGIMSINIYILQYTVLFYSVCLGCRFFFGDIPILHKPAIQIHTAVDFLVPKRLQELK